MRRVLATALLVLAFIVAFAAAGSSTGAQAFLTKELNATGPKGVSLRGTKVALPVPPRYMWGWGDGLRGYCGSFSFQSLGLLYGNYISASPLRNAADGHELLIAVNEEIAANTMRFGFEQWKWDKESVPQANGFAGWIADHIDDGHGVVVGMFERKDGGDPDYDHIMPVFGYQRDDGQMSVDGKQKKARSDVIGLHFNDLFRSTSLYGDLEADFIQTRRDCAAPGGIQPLAAPYDFCLPKNYDYGIALLGNRDDANELYPARLVMPSWTEPDYGLEDERHQAIVSFKPTLEITGLTAGVAYVVLRFDHPADVPVSDFLRGAYSKRFDFTASASNATMSAFDEFMSDATVFYRVVKNTQ
uniref:Uncharacterized protein n=1 Tax=Neobodo designis TaxID=312471 RepID=A0A6U4U2F7_NEODS|mmetsp:Transcript_39306/g.121526  ORF Transcript_39306/g.121526 Transcript_39306/m.121526 type:complete len:358 (+) Transcript_39306:29-1102(+)